MVRSGNPVTEPNGVQGNGGAAFADGDLGEGAVAPV